MKKTLSALFVVLAASVTSASAQETKIVSGKIHCADGSEVTLPEGMNYSMREFGMDRTLTPVRPRKAAAGEEMVNVTFKVVSSKRPYEGYIFNKDLNEEIDFSGKEGSIEVPKGKYDMFVSFNDVVFKYVFKENVEVTDGMVIEFDQNDANIPLEFHFFDENNKELYMDVSEGSTVVTKGTANKMVKNLAILHKDYGSATDIISMGFKKVGYPMDICVNKLSSNYVVAQSAIIGLNSHYYVYKTVIDDFEKNVYNSKAENLKRIETEFDNSPTTKGKKNVGYPGAGSKLLHNGYLVSSASTWGKSNPKDNGKVVTYIDCPEATNTEGNQVNVVACPIITDSFDEKTQGFTFINSPLVLGDATEGAKYLVVGSDVNAFINVPVEDNRYKFYPGHPEFSFTSVDGTAHFGNSVPLLSYNARRRVYAGEQVNLDTYRYLGRFGELRQTDVKIVNEETEETPNGTLVKLTNTNIEVDGIAGKNEAEVLFDFKKEDNAAPTFQMLSFKDAEGKICDRFTNINGARMLLAGGDFTYVPKTKSPYGYYTCDAPASVKAFYAPHGTENWTALTLVEKPELFFMPAFGNFYEADLSSVNVEVADTWFDVRLEMTDATGNYQKQTISPAFKVATATSIDQVKAAAGNSLVVLGKRVTLADNDKADFTVRSIDGRTMQNAYANGVDLSSMGSGIYVVTATLADSSVISTKVAM